MTAIITPPRQQPPPAITTTGTAEPTVRLHATAAEFTAAQWDRLVDDDFDLGLYSSHQWIRALEMTHGPQPVLAARAGCLTGVLPTWTSRAEDAGGLFEPVAMTRRLISMPGRHVLWLGTRRSTAATITCAPGPLRRPALTALLEEARKAAADQGLACAVWPYLSGEQALEAAACHPLAQAVLHTADTWLDVPPDGMRGIQATARSKNRRQWRHEREEFACHGTVQWTGLTPDTCSRIAALLAATRDKHGGSGGTDLMQRVLAAQRAAGLAERAAVALARRHGEDAVRAAAVFYHHGDSALYGRYWGTDGMAPPYAYFEMTLYAALDMAAQRGFRRLHLSVPASPAKLSRGAQAVPLALVYLPVSPGARLDPKAVQRHNHRSAWPWASTPGSRDRSWARWITPGG
ncbi:peptidogalycan biosysnthesis protein [Streptomyces sp. NPDC090493]|uniref:peptidogalycan biosysnthesis protein n=1 Tax=Streptomyces sp. NPDC090493 TaxID=3365964 RepID=UPI00381941E0